MSAWHCFIKKDFNKLRYIALTNAGKRFLAILEMPLRNKTI